MDQGQAFDILSFHRWRYYGLAAPIWSDARYDAFERKVVELWPWLAGNVGSDLVNDYPGYIKAGQRPRLEERTERDRMLARLERDFLLTGL